MPARSGASPSPCWWLLAGLIFASPASALDPPSGFLPRFDLDSGRSRVLPPEVDLIRFATHGEYQLRGQLQSDPILQPPAAEPGAASLGQRGKILQWFRTTPRLQITTQAEIVGQIDLLRGLVTGATTRYMDAAAIPESRANPLTIDPRWLYFELLRKIGRLRIGLQPVHQGLGLLFDDGDHPTLFGDYQRGDSAVQGQFTLRPGGRTGQVALWASGGAIFRDSWARLTEGDLAWQGMAGLTLGAETNQVGAWGALRSQRRREEARAVEHPLLERLDAQILDVHGRFATKAPGANVYLFGEGEVALLRGELQEYRSEPQRLLSWGTVLRLGIAHEAGAREERFADAVVSVAWGNASGDNNPQDGTARRFAMHPNHNVGLVLFDHLLHVQTARAATLARSIPAQERPPGFALYPTNGGVAGATYFNPTLVLRPGSRLDLKIGWVIAQATADLVDLYRLLGSGQRTNHLGGAPSQRNLGIELDGGLEWRYPLDFDMSLQLGVQAGVLFPGEAFENVMGAALAPQGLVISRVGFQY
ncbi:MAG: hypothetical protein RMJ98_00140 [Myxococcales bacterium]|nr:hypothetical protein [Polyangiaceae bacterium]MDW8247695.1 hypothetical protein [Myxococcales bacterium]